MLIDTHLNILSALESNIKQGTSRSHLGDKCSKNTWETARKAYMTEYDIGEFLGGYNLQPYLN